MYGITNKLLLQATWCSECIRDLKNEYFETGAPITDDCIALHRFCAKLEYILQNDQRDKAIFKRSKDYWDYFYRCLSTVKGVRDGLKFVKTLTDVKSSLGKGRAFIRFSLVHQQLADCLQQCIFNNKVTSDWYYDTSILLQKDYFQPLITKLYDLNSIVFDLSSGHDLDSSWPTFSRKSFSSPVTWDLPLHTRSTSLSSLNSTLSQLSEHLASPEKKEAPSLDLEILREELAKLETANKNLTLTNKELIEEKEEFQREITETRNDLMSIKNNLQQNTYLYNLEKETLMKELEIKESQWRSKEDSLNLLLEKSEKLTCELNQRIELITAQRESNESFNIQLKTLQDKVFLLESSKEEHTEEMKIELERRFALEKNELIHTFETEKSEIVKNVNLFLEKIKDLMADKVNLFNQLPESPENINLLLDQFTKQWLENQSLINELMQKKNQLSESYQELLNQNTILNKQHDILKQQFQSYCNTKPEMQDKSEECNINTQHADQEVQNQLFLLTEKLNTLSQTTENEKMQLKEEILQADSNNKDLTKLLQEENEKILNYCEIFFKKSPYLTGTFSEDLVQEIFSEIKKSVLIGLLHDPAKNNLSTVMMYQGEISENCWDSTQTLVNKVSEKDDCEISGKIEYEENSNAKLKEQIETLEEKYCTLIKENENLKEVLNTHTPAVIESSLQCNFLDNEKVYLKDMNDFEKMNHMLVESKSLQDENTELKIKLSQVEKQLADKIQEVNTVSDQLTQNSEEFKLVQLDLEQQLTSVKFQQSSEAMKYESALMEYSSHEEDLSLMSDKILGQEQLIEYLQQQLIEIRDGREVEKEELNLRANEVALVLSTRDEECTQLSEDLKKKTKLLDEKRKLAEKLENQLSVLKITSDVTIKNLNISNSQMSKDLSDLKKKVIELIKVKDNLWKKTDHLQHQQRLKAAERWLGDNEVNYCLGCKMEFNFVLRKHHCRLCGRIFCYQCANGWIMTTASSKLSRVCQECFISHSEIEDTSTSSLLQCNEEDVPSLEKPVVRTSSPEIEDNQLEKADNKENKIVSAEVSNPFDAPSQSPDQASDFAATTNALTSKIDDADDDFHIIDDEEIARSLSGSSPYQPLTKADHSSLMLSIDEIQENEGEQERQVWINAGKSFSVYVNVSIVGVALKWTFTSEPKSIAFAVEFEEKDDNGEVLSHEILCPMSKCSSHKQTIEGWITAHRVGYYKFTFDNSFSRFTTKKIKYQITVVNNDYCDNTDFYS